MLSGKCLECRQGGHTELCELARALGVHVRFWDVESKVFVIAGRDLESALDVSLLSTGNHIELVFE